MFAWIIHAIRILSEAMWRLFWEAFEIWVADKVLDNFHRDCRKSNDWKQDSTEQPSENTRF